MHPKVELASVEPLDHRCQTVQDLACKSHVETREIKESLSKRDSDPTSDLPMICLSPSHW